MNEGNFLEQAKGIITGETLLQERGLPLFSSVLVAATGVPCAAGSAPTAAVKGISFDDAETALLKFVIPTDYDPAADKMYIVLEEVPVADTAHTTDLGLTTAQSLFHAGAAVDETAVDAVAEDATASTGALTRENILDISGNGYQAGDVVIRTLDANNSAGTELILLGAKMRYGSSIVAYDHSLR